MLQNFKINLSSIENELNQIIEKQNKAKISLEDIKDSTNREKSLNIEAEKVLKKLENYLSPLEKDLSIEYLGKKLGINKETLVNELSFKEDLITTTFNQSENVEENKHIETFKDIFISNLIKNNFDLKDNEKELLELNIELNEQIKAIKSNLDSTENDKYNNISFSEEQLEEAIVRLILFYSELKIQDLINQIDLSKDTSLFPEVEELKKNIEYYQNTL